MDIKENVKNRSVWLRGLYIVIFGVILYFVFGLIWLLVIFQFVSKVLTGNLNQQLSNFSAGLAQYAFLILSYITFQSEERPFPFSPWPATDKTTVTTRPKSRSRTARSSARKKVENS